MLFIWLMIVILYFMLETIKLNYNNLCFALGAILALFMQICFHRFFWSFLVFIFGGTGFMLWLKPIFYEKKLYSKDGI